jgi:hypothetical protein
MKMVIEENAAMKRENAELKAKSKENKSRKATALYFYFLFSHPENHVFV